MKKYTIYARFSTDKQNPLSCKDQINLCKKWIEQQKSYQIVNVYMDEAVSGTIKNRTNLIKLLKSAENKDFDVLVIESLDRLSRNQAQIANIIEIFEYLNIDIYTLDQQWINPINSAVGGLLSSMFIKNLKQKVIRGQDAAIERGILPVVDIYGYERNPDKTFKINPAQAKIVKDIFEKYISGWSLEEISEYLFSIGTPLGFHKIRNILHRKLYIGIFEFRKFTQKNNPINNRCEIIANENIIVKEFEYLKIIDKQTFDIAQKRYIKRSNHTKNFTNYLFKGKLKCQNCKRSFKKYQVKKYNYLICETRLLVSGKNCKYIKSINYDDLVDKIIQKLIKRLKHSKAEHNILKNIDNQNYNFSSDKKNIMNLVNVSQDINQVIAYLYKKKTKHTVNINKIINFVKTNYAKYKQNPDNIVVINNINFFIAEVFAIRVGNTMNTKDYEFKVKIDWKNIANNLEMFDDDCG